MPPRDRFAVLIALATTLALIAMLGLAKSQWFLMPGPLSSAHAGIKACSSCHGKAADRRLGWLHGLIAGDPIADSKQCSRCHRMPDTALDPHGATADALKQSTARMQKALAAVPPPPPSALAKLQGFAFPTAPVMAQSLACATCHKEHRSTDAKLTAISSDQCAACHVAKFNSFGAAHPAFDGYPFRRRTRLVYDHAAHFTKHYPEVAKKNPAVAIPATCSACHNDRNDRRVMAVEPFEKTCAACHGRQISGVDRVSGPKGIAFLTLPGLDVQSLQKRNVPIGEWPAESEEPLTAFMKVLIGRSAAGRTTLQAVDRLNLQDLSAATDDQLKAVNDLAWETKRLLFALTSGKVSDVFADVAKSLSLEAGAIDVAALTAGMPRDVVLAAQHRWLPNLTAEMAQGPGAKNKPSASQPIETAGPTITAPEPDVHSASTEAASQGPPPQQQRPEDDAGQPPAAAAAAPRKEQPCLMRVLGQCLVTKSSPEPDTGAEQKDRDPPVAQAKPGAVPPAMRAGLGELQGAGPGSGESRDQRRIEHPFRVAADDTTSAKTSESSAATPKADKSDDLLFPTAEELRDMNARLAAQGRKPADAAPPAAREGGSVNASDPQAKAADEASDEAGDVDAETWADHGGWYQQDYSIFYRPAEHDDRFMSTWLSATAAIPNGRSSAARAIFDGLTAKDAPGACAKCHSVDQHENGTRTINFSPLKAAAKPSSLTRFAHEPHFGTVGDKGCLTCHALQQGRPYLKSYEQGDPQTLAPQFGLVKKEVCQTCHRAGKARSDCLLCHDYHVSRPVSPITGTKNATD